MQITTQMITDKCSANKNTAFKLIPGISNSSKLNSSLITSHRKEPNKKWNPSAFSKYILIFLEYSK